jgi:F-type H+-transporting ATPase subunit epsilon
MSQTLQVEIVTPTSVAYQAVATEVTAPGFHGEFGVLVDHSPFLSVITPGVVTIQTEDGTDSFVVGRGFVEAGPRRVVLLTESCQLASEVDASAAAGALEQAEKDLASSEPGSGEHKDADHRAQMARARAASGA